MNQYRQGDVFVEECNEEIDINECRSLFSVDEDVILAYGEATGHAHRIKDRNVKLYEDKKSNLYLVVNKDCALTHEEHSTIPLKTSIYRVYRQRQYSPESISVVAD